MNEPQQIIQVGIADMNFVQAPNLIRTSGLGSCVGVVIYDEFLKLAGLAHIMLPNSSFSKNEPINPAKYADTAIINLVFGLVEQGARQTFLKAKMAGGAQMFQFSSGNEMMRIGPRNVEAVKSQLLNLNILIVGEDVGGNNGRTIEFDPTTGILSIRTINKGVTYL